MVLWYSIAPNQCLEVIKLISRSRRFTSLQAAVLRLLKRSMLREFVLLCSEQTIAPLHIEGNCDSTPAADAEATVRKALSPPLLKTEMQVHFHISAIGELQ